MMLGGSMDHKKLVNQLIKIICEVRKFRDPSFNSAVSEFIRLFELKFPDTIAPSDLPVIFKCTEIESCDFENKNIELRFDEWPVALVGDGCSVNSKAGETLLHWFGLIAPTTRCSGHAASGSIRRLTTSKTMQVSVPNV